MTPSHGRGRHESHSGQRTRGGEGASVFRLLPLRYAPGLEAAKRKKRCQRKQTRLAKQHPPGANTDPNLKTGVLGSATRATSILRDEHGQKINPKRVWRVRRERGLLASRKSGRRRRVSRKEAVRRSASRADEVWSYDFISDATAEGRSERILSVIDEYTREPASIPVFRMMTRQTLLVCGKRPSVTVGLVTIKSLARTCCTLDFHRPARPPSPNPSLPCETP
jgi:hypothetical protein